MSNGELAFLLFLILTVGHYAVIWSIYLEKQLVRLGGGGRDSWTRCLTLRLSRMTC